VRPLVLAAFRIAAKDLRLRLRDRSALIVAFFAPFGIAMIISFALGDISSFRATFAVANGDGAEFSRAFVDGIRNAPNLRGVITLRDTADAAEARSLVASGSVGAGLVFPAGFSDDVRAGRGATVTVLRSADSPISGEVAQALATSFAAELGASRLALDTAIAAGAAGEPPSPERVAALADAAASTATPVRLVDGSVGAGPVRTASYFAPSMAIFFLFYTVQFGALGVLAERRDGTLARLLAAPIAREAVLLGKALGMFVLGLVSLGVMIASTTALLGASWGPPLAVASIALATVLAAMGITALAATFAATEERAAGFVSIVALGLSLLGGTFIPIDQAPPIMRTIALATPNGIALRAFTDLVADGGGVVSTLPAVTGILAFAIGCGAVALRRGGALVAA